MSLHYVCQHPLQPQCPNTALQKIYLIKIDHHELQKSVPLQLQKSPKECLKEQKSLTTIFFETNPSLYYRQSTWNHLLSLILVKGKARQLSYPNFSKFTKYFPIQPSQKPLFSQKKTNPPATVADIESIETTDHLMQPFKSLMHMGSTSCHTHKKVLTQLWGGCAQKSYKSEGVICN